MLGVSFALMAFNTSLEESEDDEPQVVDPDMCKCGKKHGTQASPNPRGTRDLGFVETACIQSISMGTPME